MWKSALTNNETGYRGWGENQGGADISLGIPFYQVWTFELCLTYAKIEIYIKIKK